MSKPTVKDIAEKLATMPQALAKIDDLSKELSAKESSLTELHAEVQDLRKSIEGNLVKIATVEEDKEKAVKAHTEAIVTLTAEFETKLQAQKTEFEGKINALTTTVKETETSVNAKVANELMSIGVSESVIKEATPVALTKEQAIEAYKKLSPVEQRAFYVQHKALLNS